MKQLFSDIINLVKNMNHVDFLLYFSILVLIILVVSLIYIIKTSEDEEFVVDTFNSEDIDLKEVVENIENTEPPTVEFTSYERDQEEKAIISYDELIARSKTATINYGEEEIIDDELTIKKIDLDSIVNTNEIILEEKTRENHLFKYTNEEAFLQALKQLNELLN